MSKLMRSNWQKVPFSFELKKWQIKILRYVSVRAMRAAAAPQPEADLSHRLFLLHVFISHPARERLVWNFPNFLSHSNFLPIRARDTRPERGRLVVGALPLVVWLPELAANGARPEFRAQPRKLPSVFNHRAVSILTVEPLTGHDF